MLNEFNLTLNYRDGFLDDGFRIEYENGDSFTCMGRNPTELLIQHLTARFHVEPEKLQFFVRIPVDE